MVWARLVGAVEKRISPHVRDRAEELLLGWRPFERLHLPPESALSIICDDGSRQDLDIVEVLERHRVKGVFAVSPALIGRAGFLDAVALRALSAAGHEVAFHGDTHDPFTAVAAATLRGAIDDGVQRLRAEGLGTPRTLVYPFGRHNRAVRAVVAGAFDCAFTTWFGINRGCINRYAIRRIALGAYSGTLPATEDWYRGLLDRAAAGHCWPTLMVHPGSAGHVAAHTAMLSRLIAYAVDRGLAVRTVRAHLGALGGPTGRAASEHGPT